MPESSEQSAERIACRQWANTVAEQTEPSGPIGGHPMSQETNLGLSRGESRIGSEEFCPSVEVVGSGREDWKISDWIVSGMPAPLPLFAVSFKSSRRASQVSGVSPS